MIVLFWIFIYIMIGASTGFLLFKIYEDSDLDDWEIVVSIFEGLFWPIVIPISLGIYLSNKFYKRFLEK